MNARPFAISRRGVAIASLLVLAACGGNVASSDRAPDGAGTSPQPPAPDAPAIGPGKGTGVATSTASPSPDLPGTLETTATRDGKPLYLTMCFAPSPDQAGLRIWGEVTDPAFEVDEAVIAFEVTPRDALGSLACTSTSPGARVVFAEGRGAEYEADGKACELELDDNGAVSGTARGRVRAEYVDAASVRHAFAVSFAARACAH